MIINTEKPQCPNCLGRLQKISQTVVDETDEGMVLLVVGFCSCHNDWYQWYEHCRYAGYFGLEATGKICARS